MELIALEAKQHGVQDAGRSTAGRPGTAVGMASDGPNRKKSPDGKKERGSVEEP